MFDEQAAQRVIGFIEGYCRHTKGQQWKGNLIQLHPFWKDEVIKPLFGTLKKDGTRQYTQAYIEIARKNAKSTICAALCLYFTFADGERGGEIYCCAADRDQASIVFDIAVGMVEQELRLKKRCKIISSQKRIVHLAHGNILRVLSHEAHTKHGFNPSAVIFDELHAQPNGELWDVMTSGSDTRIAPMIIAITTAGWNKESVCYEEHEYAEKIIDGINKDDKSYFAVIKNMDKKDDWNDETKWFGPNPGLFHPEMNPAGWIDIEKMRNAFIKAKESPRKENTFRRLRLNQWTEQEDRWISMESWAACMDKGVDARIWRKQMMKDLAGSNCEAGLDLGSTSDLTAFALLFTQGKETICLPWFWLPEDGDWRRDSRYRALYQVWIDHGFITLTEGNACDYEQVENDIVDISEKFTFPRIQYDYAFQGAQLCNDLMGDGFDVVPISAGFAKMHAPSIEFERRILNGDFKHGNNPVLTWMASNVTVARTGDGKMIRPVKPKGQRKLKIDGIVAAIMALIGMIKYEEDDGPSVYEKRGLLWA